MTNRKNIRAIKIGNIQIDGGAPIAVQSMTNTKTNDVVASVAQINALAAAGCDIVRLAVPDLEAAQALKQIKYKVNVPLIADIHFEYRLALAAMESGIDALRLNPGNIGDEDRVKTVVKEAKKRHIPIRIGVNAGSLDKVLLAKYGRSTPEAMVEMRLID